ncbi:FKBP-type peptidyl-prolyl cis-trans isomerase [Flavobacterium gilvum]|uniref:Peptidyl-prolyl cis-trans isomerase n=1 Tax=Flavobacterium gilvum TaxID=1492737 RepID=A0AAC9I679_9FLAO|nr:FKBP-type peptidyl-prolyl cis-trans isomerase [Flavobacterium gilvum]AOW11251.1 peptidylprolyl isomerase [Flavobacterium gilvum]
MKYTFLAILVTFFVSCTTKDTPEEEVTPIDYSAQNDKEIQTYIANNQLDAHKTSSGLYYVITEEGTGKQPTGTSNITVTYKAYFTNKTVFDQSADSGISFNLSQVIKGWNEGLQYFKEGGSGILLIPAHLGYGSFNYNGIPGGTVLVFDVKLISVNN